MSKHFSGPHLLLKATQRPVGGLWYAHGRANNSTGEQDW